MLNLGHPQIVLALIVRKRNDWVLHEAQGFVLVVDQALQQIAGFGAFLPTALSRVGRGARRRTFVLGIGQDVPVSDSVGLRCLGRELTTGGMHYGVDLFQPRRSG